MSGRAFLLVLSLAANVALLGAILFSSRRSEPAQTSVEATASAEKSRATKPNQASPAEHPTDARAWERLRHEDLPTLVARLRAAGFPPGMLRAAVTAVVDERFAARRRTLEAAAEKPFWKGREEIDPKIRQDLTALDRERRKRIQDLLGSEMDESDPDIRVSIRQEIGRDLSPEKIARLHKLRSDFSDRFSVLYEQQGPSAELPEDQGKFRELQTEMHAELAKFLSAEELFEYDLRNSVTAGMLRYEISALRPTESEFRSLFPLYRELDEKYPLKQAGVTTDEYLVQRNAALAQMKDRIQAVLGPERFAEYELSRDYNYQQTAKVTERLNLPSTATGAVYAVQKETQQRAALVRANRTLPAEERTAQLAALANESSAKISAVLGPDGFEAYKQHGGQWLQQLTPRPRPNAKAP